MTTAGNHNIIGQYPLYSGGGGRYPTTVLSFGLGLDSTAVLLRWLHEPSCRDVDLDDLVVITAMTGDEFASTARDVEEAVLPAMRRHRIRYIQVGRNRATPPAPASKIGSHTILAAAWPEFRSS